MARKPRKPRKPRGPRRSRRSGLKVEIKVEAEVAERIREFARLIDRPMKEVLERIGDRLRYEVLPGNIDAGGRPEPFAPLATATQNIREWRYGATLRTGPILFRRGDLRNSLEVLETTDNSISIGSRHPFARLHERGYTTSPKSRIPSKKVPARPWIQLAAQHVDEIFRDIEERFFEGTDR